MTSKSYVVYYRFKPPAEKAKGSIRHYRLYATSVDEAKKLVAQYANYPNLEVLDVKRG